MRLDKFLVDKNFFPSRARAQFAISQKLVKVDGVIVDKPSKEILETTTIEIIDLFNKYVSRGGLKLEKAIQDFGLQFENKLVLDIGSSTGGFVDCALQHGAKYVYGVDVGTSQLHPSLRIKENVCSIENKDFRDLQIEDVHGQKFDFIVSDLSFISLTYIIPYLKTFVSDKSQIMFLIKPQFEAGASFLNRSGIVRDFKGYKVAIQRVVAEMVNHGYHLNALSISTLFEKNKNVEFLSLFSEERNGFELDYKELMQEVKRVISSL